MSSYLRMIESVTSRYNDQIQKASRAFCDYFGLVQFWYNRIDDRGSFMSLSNHAEWTEFFAGEEFYHQWPLIRGSQHIQEGIMILNDFQEGSDMNNVLVHGKSKYEMNVWISLVYKTKTGSEQFGFCTKRKGVSLFFNELSLIHCFAKKFRENNRFVLSKLENHQVNIIDLIGDTFNQPSSLLSVNAGLRNDALKTLGIPQDVRLNPKEIQAIRLVLQGYSASEIAPQIFLAKRSVEHLLERVKDKLLCNSKRELIQKARELETLQYFSTK